jgi:hypothetical protein
MFSMLNRIEEMLNALQTPKFEAVLKGFQKEIKAINESLPDEALIALVIDPRHDFFFVLFFFNYIFN